MSAVMAIFIVIVAVIVVILTVTGIFLTLLLEVCRAIGQIFSLLWWIGKFFIGVIKALLFPFRRQ